MWFYILVLENLKEEYIIYILMNIEKECCPIYFTNIYDITSVSKPEKSSKKYSCLAHRFKILNKTLKSNLAVYF